MADHFKNDVAAVQRIDAVPRILEIVCRITGMGFAAVARVTEDRWIACAVRDSISFGLGPGGELEVATTICHEIRQSGEAVVIDHVSKDSGFCGHPVPAKYGFESYISVPIVLSDGSFFGTLCAIDPKPARVNTLEIVGTFKLFAELIACHLETEAHLASSHAVLHNERRTSELREQFIAVLGHDLRNPLAAIAAGVRMLQKATLDARSASVLAQMQNSVVRMTGLINNVLDFARGRLGGGFALERSRESIVPVLEQVIEELLATHPECRVDADFSVRRTHALDHNRMAQLFSNLLGNALSYGKPGTPVRVRVRDDADSFEIEVANAGDPISPEAKERLFMPFARGQVKPSQQGLGLGLFISSEIARAHGGFIDVTSTPEETRFVLKIPSGEKLPNP